ncbi:WXG100 family type VII secretion target [Gordonia sp. CPCC 205515]|uniref:WXG100 family type VII secretion target n=1 Tax=Gordonia sp. CPCC 205515 TaxID=3140791 RepID=UPI003AF336D6
MADTGGSADLSVIPDDVAELGRLSAQTAETMRAALGSTGGHVETLLGSGWCGTAADSFGAGWNECRHGGERIISILETLAVAVGGSANRYVGQEGDNSDSFARLNL